MERPLFELKPQIAVAIIPAIFWGLVIGAVIGFFAFGPFSVLGAVIVGLVVALVMIFLSLMNLRARRYIFYNDKAEFYEGFLNIVQRTVRYEKITDCILRKSVWDRIFGTGTIKLVTAGHVDTGRYSGAGGGIAIEYVERPDEVYKKVEHLLKKH